MRGEIDKDEKPGSVGRGMMSSNLTHERLVKIVLGLMEENVWRQKFLAGLDIKERRRQMLEENFAKRLALQTSHGRLNDEDGLSGSSQDDLSQMMRGRDTSPHLPPEQSEIDDPQAKPDKQAHEASVPNWYPNQNNMVQPETSHMSLREPSEGGNRMAQQRANYSKSNQAILVNRGKHIQIRAGSIDDQLLIDEPRETSQFSWNRDEYRMHPGHQANTRPMVMSHLQAPSRPAYQTGSQNEVRLPEGAQSQKRCKSNQNNRMFSKR